VYDPTTRACIITPLGEGGIGIVALVGSGAADVLGQVFVGSRKTARSIRPGQIAHGVIRWQGCTVDEVIVARPHATPFAVHGPYYEVNCHGGVVAVRTVLTCLVQAGATRTTWQELAQPSAGGGLLSRSAVRARSQLALLHAPTRLGASMLLHQAAGALTAEIEAIAHCLADGDAEEALARLDLLIAAAPLGIALLHPPAVALVGPANAGKSTLLNALLEEERAIVHHQPGTTRDIVTDVVSMRGVPFELMDSAGIRATDDELEQHAVRRSAELAAGADVVLLVFDVLQGLPDDVEAWLPRRADVRTIRVANKIDLLDAAPPEQASATPTVHVSAAEGTNLDRLEDALLGPYAHAMQPCREGAPMIFEAESLDAIRAVRDALTEGDAAAALDSLQELLSEGESEENG